MSAEAGADRNAETGERQLPGERLARWIPVALSVAGLVGSMAAAGFAVDAASADDEVIAGSGAAVADDGAEDPVGSGGSTTTVATTTAPEASSTTTVPSVPDERETTTVPTDCPPLFTVRFALGSAAPLGDHEADVVDLVSWIDEHPDAQLLIDGHADAGGTEQTNLRLSFRRAEAVAALLVDAGVDPQRLQARGFGEYQPIVGAPPDSEANRRVTMQVAGLELCPIVDEETDR